MPHPHEVEAQQQVRKVQVDAAKQPPQQPPDAGHPRRVVVGVALNLPRHAAQEALPRFLGLIVGECVEREHEHQHRQADDGHGDPHDCLVETPPSVHGRQFHQNLPLVAIQLQEVRTTFGQTVQPRRVRHDGGLVSRRIARGGPQVRADHVAPECRVVEGQPSRACDVPLHERLHLLEQSRVVAQKLLEKEELEHFVQGVVASRLAQRLENCPVELQIFLVEELRHVGIFGLHLRAIHLARIVEHRVARRLVDAPVVVTHPARGIRPPLFKTGRKLFLVIEHQQTRIRQLDLPGGARHARLCQRGRSLVVARIVRPTRGLDTRTVQNVQPVPREPGLDHPPSDPYMHKNRHLWHPLGLVQRRPTPSQVDEEVKQDGIDEVYDGHRYDCDGNLDILVALMVTTSDERRANV